MNLADIMLNSGKVIEAHSYLNAASSTFVSVDHKLLWLRNKARAFSMMGLYGESLDLLRTSIELDPLQLDIYLPCKINLSIRFEQEYLAFNFFYLKSLLFRL